MAIDLFPSGGGGGLASTGFVSAAPSTGTGEDAKYIDVTISAVADIAKCDVSFVGTGVSSGANAASSAAHRMSYSGEAVVVNLTGFAVAPRLTSPTNLRLATAGSSCTYITGRWYVKEYT
jgi:hypothetical protein